MDSRAEFCRLGLMAGANIRELCRRAGISPQTGYKWMDRFEREGEAGLTDRPRRLLSSPGRTTADVEALVLAGRRDPEQADRITLTSDENAAIRPNAIMVL